MNVQETLEKLKSESHPALHLVASEQASTRSKLGGRPNLPPGVAWPLWKEAPLAFLAQIELSELPDPAPIEGMPRQGRLCFFYEQEQTTWGFDPADLGSWRVLHDPSETPSEPAEFPAGLPDGMKFPERKVAFKPITTYPSLERFGEAYSFDGDDELYDQMEALFSGVFQDLPRHQIGGYPTPVQGDTMELECQLVSNGIYCGDPSGYRDPRVDALSEHVADWKLLLQIDSDDDLDVMWGDCGLIYFWIRQQDLEKADFSKVWMVLQCS